MYYEIEEVKIVSLKPKDDHLADMVERYAVKMELLSECDEM